MRQPADSLLDGLIINLLICLSQNNSFTINSFSLKAVPLMRFRTDLE